MGVFFHPWRVADHGGEVFKDIGAPRSAGLDKTPEEVGDAGAVHGFEAQAIVSMVRL